MEQDWPPSQENIERMWRQIVAQHTPKRKYTSKEWQEAYDDFVQCMRSPAQPFVVDQSVGGLTISKPTTAAASKAPEAHSVASSAPASESDVEALETVDLCEDNEEGASGGASYVPPKNEGSSEPDNSEENGSEEESASEGELSSQSDDKENAYAVVEAENENPTEDSSLSPTSSEMSSLVGFSETENETEDETENDQEGEEQQKERIEENASQQDIDNLQGAVGGTVPPDDQSEEEEKKNDEEVQAEGAAGGSTGEGFSEAELCTLFNNLPKILTPEGKQTLGLPERNPTNIKKSKKSRKKNKKRRH